MVGVAALELLLLEISRFDLIHYNKADHVP